MIVFTRTKHGANKVCERLEAAGVWRGGAARQQEPGAAREIARSFSSGRARVLVATDIASRGIDVTGVSHVINYDLPVEPESYIHRIGRTGRAGASGIAISFCDGGERAALRAIERCRASRWRWSAIRCRQATVARPTGRSAAWSSGATVVRAAGTAGPHNAHITPFTVILFTVMPGDGRTSTTLRASQEVVDGRPPPTMTGADNGCA